MDKRPYVYTNALLIEALSDVVMYPLPATESPEFRTASSRLSALLRTCQIPGESAVEFRQHCDQTTLTIIENN